MKTSFPVLIFLLSNSFLFLSGKSRIGEYYIGFGYGLFDESNKAFEGDSINLFVNSPGSETVDFDLSYTYAGLETNSSRETYWRFGLNLRYHFDDFYEGDFFHWDSQNKQHINTPGIQKIVKGENTTHLLKLLKKLLFQGFMVVYTTEWLSKKEFRKEKRLGILYLKTLRLMWILTNLQKNKSLFFLNICFYIPVFAYIYRLINI